MRRLLVLTAVLLGSALGSGCGDQAGRPRADDTTDPASPTSSSVVLVEDANQAPPIVLHTQRGDIEPFPASSCWSSGDSSSCADMVAPLGEDLEVVDSDDEITFTFPVKGWSFEATFSPVGGDRCQRTHSADAVLLQDGLYSLTPAGPPGDYRVDLFGTGPQGDTGGTFRWKTDVAGALPTPESTVSVVWAPHGELEGQGFLMFVSALATEPELASVSITATAASGRSSTLTRPAQGWGRCFTGDLVFSEARGEPWSEEVAGLGPAPFTYDVTLTVDGVQHLASAVWPDDHVEDPGNDNPAPVPLEFDPPLS